jgi:cobyrinic acid a,c-diamide synthase
LGSFGKLALQQFPQRHLGLLPLFEHPRAQEFLDAAAEAVMLAADLDKIIEIANSALPLEAGVPDQPTTQSCPVGDGLRIGIIRDSAFQFYYPENLEALKALGASLVELSALDPVELPPLDGLYLGGGFPETHAEILADNQIFKNSLMRQVQSDLPVYAECGGLMYLSRSLNVDDKTYPMVGAFPIDVTLHRRPQGHGYIKVEVSQKNPFYPVGTVLTGHEFHYSSVNVEDEDIKLRCCFKVTRGHGFDGERDGICCYNCLGTYVHLHVLGAPSWAVRFVNAAADFAARKRFADGPS